MAIINAKISKEEIVEDFKKGQDEQGNEIRIPNGHSKQLTTTTIDNDEIFIKIKMRDENKAIFEKEWLNKTIECEATGDDNGKFFKVGKQQIKEIKSDIDYWSATVDNVYKNAKIIRAFTKQEKNNETYKKETNTYMLISREDNSSFNVKVENANSTTIIEYVSKLAQKTINLHFVEKRTTKNFKTNKITGVYFTISSELQKHIELIK